MPSGSSALGFGGGLAKGLASVYGQKRQDDVAEKHRKDARQQEVALSVFSHLLGRDDIKDYGDLQPYLDMAMGTTGDKPKKGEINPHDMLSRVLSPVLASRGDAPTGEPSVGGPTALPASASSSPVAGTGDQFVTPGTPASPGAPAGPAIPADASAASGAPAPMGTGGAPGQRLGGVQLRSDDEMIAREAHKADSLALAKDARQTKQAREFYETFRKIDPDFELRDALRMAGFNVDINRGGGSRSAIMRGFDAQVQRKEAELGRPLTADEAEEVRTEWYAANRSLGTNRETLSRTMFGKPPTMLEPEELAAVVKAETSLLGGQSYARTAGGNQADYNAPITPTQSATTELPVGTTGPQLAGQQIPTAGDRDARRGTENMLTQLTNIRSLLGVLPKQSDLIGGRLPGAAILVAKRAPATREAFAKLEAAVDTVVGAAARNLQQQRGAQTEKDAERAYNAAVQLKTSMWDPANGDTQESAAARLTETEKLVKQVLSQLPAAPVPTGGKPGASAAPVANPADKDPARRARARKFLADAKKLTDDATVDLFLGKNPTFK